MIMSRLQLHFFFMPLSLGDKLSISLSGDNKSVYDERTKGCFLLLLTVFIICGNWFKLKKANQAVDIID